MSECPLNNGCYSGNCEFCSQKMDGVLLAILQKVVNLERAIKKMASQTARNVGGQRFESSTARCQ